MEDCSHGDVKPNCRFCATLFVALKGASGPRKGQKSTFSYNLFCELTFSPTHADLGV
jgi:hypothetical protein